MPDLTEIRCPACSGLQVAKRGKRKTKTGSTQLYQCKKCKKIFSCSALPNYSYPPQAVIAAPMFYYRGYSLEQTRQRIIGRFKVAPSLATVYGWIRKFGKYVGEKEDIKRKGAPDYSPRGQAPKAPPITTLEGKLRTQRDRMVQEPTAAEIEDVVRNVLSDNTHYRD